jgi:hypothetical protein
MVTTSPLPGGGMLGNAPGVRCVGIWGLWQYRTAKRFAAVAQSVSGTGWKVMGSSSVKGEIFRTHPEQLWGPPSFLYNEYRVSFLGGKAAGAWRYPTPITYIFNESLPQFNFIKFTLLLLHSFVQEQFIIRITRPNTPIGSTNESNRATYASPQSAVRIVYTICHH